MTRHLLLAVAGHTPATVTEAVYALAVAGSVPLREVRVLTTRGAEGALSGKLSEVLTRMKHDFPRQLKELRLDVRSVELEDIRTDEDNISVADWILLQASEACTDQETVVHASLAGGRKTMSFYLGAAMQLVARPQDRLYHVLVPPECERDQSFFYPRPGSKMKVELSAVPWVPLRGLLGERVAGYTFRQLVARAADALGGNFLDVHVGYGGGKATVTYGPLKGRGSVIDECASANSFRFVFYTWLLNRRVEGKDPVSFSLAENIDGLVRDFASWARRIAPGGETALVAEGLVKMWESTSRMRKGARREDPKEDFIHEEWLPKFEPWVSRSRQKLTALFEKNGVPADPAKYAICTNGAADFHVRIPAERIHFVELKKGRRGG